MSRVHPASLRMAFPMLWSVLLLGGVAPGLASPGQSGAEPREAESAATQARDSDEIRSAVDDVLSAPEYKRLLRSRREDESEQAWKLPRWLERFLEWMSRHTAVLASAGFLIRGLAYLVVIALVTAIAIAIAKGIRARLPSSAVTRSLEDAAYALVGPPGELPADEYVRRALEHAAAGDHKAAIRELLLGTMSWIERAGLIRFRRGLTNRDYLRAVWRRPACRDSLSGIADAFDRTYFGRRAATAKTFDNCLELYRQGFAANETGALAS
jgi:hypothetical protein